MFGLQICSIPTQHKKVTAGLVGSTAPPHLKAVHFGPPNGRGVIALEDITMRDFVCEYETYKVYSVNSAEEKRLADEYEVSRKGSFVVYTA